MATWRARHPGNFVQWCYFVRVERLEAAWRVAARSVAKASSRPGRPAWPGWIASRPSCDWTEYDKRCSGTTEDDQLRAVGPVRGQELVGGGEGRPARGCRGGGRAWRMNRSRPPGVGPSIKGRSRSGPTTAIDWNGLARWPECKMAGLRFISSRVSMCRNVTSRTPSAIEVKITTSRKQKPRTLRWRTSLRRSPSVEPP